MNSSALLSILANDTLGYSSYGLLFTVQRSISNNSIIWENVEELTFSAEKYMTITVRRDSKTNSLSCFFSFPEKLENTFLEKIAARKEYIIKSRGDVFVDKIDACTEHGFNVASLDCIQQFNENNLFPLTTDLFHKYECFFALLGDITITNIDKVIIF